MPCPLVPPYGTYIRILWAQGLANEIDLTLSSTNNKFRADPNGPGRLRRLGWVYGEDPTYQRGDARSYTGKSYPTGFQKKPPILFSGRFFLTDAEYYLIHGMWLSQQENMDMDIVLYDHRFMFREAVSATRPSFDNAVVAPDVAPGTVAYWGIFRTELKEPELVVDAEARGEGIKLCNLEFIERYPPLLAAP